MSYKSKSCVIFDLDGVLVNTTQLHVLAFKQAFTAEGFSVNKDELRFLVSSGYSRGVVIEKLIRKESGDVKRKIAYIKGQKTRTLLQKNTVGESEYIPPLIKGVESLISFIQKKNLLLAVASSSCLSLNVLEAVDIKHYFKFVSFPVRGVEPKPNPGVYLKVLEKFKINANACIAIEDSLTGLKAAQKANIDTILLSDSSKSITALSKRTLVFNELQKIQQYFEKIL